MRFAVDIPNYGVPDEDGLHFGNPQIVAELAHEAEEAGWDGFFIWDHIGADWNVQLYNSWIVLAAVAMRTTTIRLGPMVTPLPRRRPWSVARETATLDHLSNGRLILGVGIGGGNEYTLYDEPDDPRVHGAMLDEGLDVLAGLWSGEPFSYDGKYYHLTNIHHQPRPVQERIPIWVAGIWPNKKPLRRAAKHDGVFPIGKEVSLTEQLSPETMREIVAYVCSERPTDGDTLFDIVHAGVSSEDALADRERAAAYAEAGVTWWVDHFSNDRGSFKEQRERVRRGPPRPQ